VRTITGFWIVVIILGSILIHPVSFILLGLIMVLGSLHEYYRLVSLQGIKSQHLAGLISGGFIYLVSVAHAMQMVSAKIYLLFLLFPMYILIFELFTKKNNPFQSIAQTFTGVIYTSVPFSLFPFMAFGEGGMHSFISSGEVEYSPAIILGFFLLLWINDTGAYLTGITIGKTKLFERISPKKTWEGFIGGLVLNIVAAWFLSGWFGVVGRIDWLILALLISIGGTLGDLVESLLKRTSGVKDSGHFLPGHGGFLDRFDGVLIAFPLLFLYISLFG